VALVPSEAGWAVKIHANVLIQKFMRHIMKSASTLIAFHIPLFAAPTGAVFLSPPEHSALAQQKHAEARSVLYGRFKQDG
jgi:hypothetical protein